MAIIIMPVSIGIILVFVFGLLCFLASVASLKFPDMLVGMAIGGIFMVIGYVAYKDHYKSR